MLSQRDLDVLSILWAADRGLTATEIVEQKKGLTQSTVTAVLRKLLKDKLVEVVGVTHSGRVLSRMYRPSEKSLQAILDYLKAFYVRFSGVVSMSEICRHILEIDREDEERMQEEIMQLKKFLQDFESEAT